MLLGQLEPITSGASDGGGSEPSSPLASPGAGVTAAETLAMPAEEERVLDADVPRTRRELEYFRKPAVQEALTSLLAKWCMSHDTKYRQGLNEILAPFVALQEPKQSGTDAGDGGAPAPLDDRERYVMFDAFVCEYLGAFYLLDDDEATARRRAQRNGLSQRLARRRQRRQGVNIKGDATAEVAGKGRGGGGDSNGAGGKASGGGGSGGVLGAYMAITGRTDSRDKVDGKGDTGAAGGGKGGEGAGVGKEAEGDVEEEEEEEEEDEEEEEEEEEVAVGAEVGLPLALQLFPLLLKFHDPSLARQLEREHIGPELYATAWFITGRLPPPLDADSDHDLARTPFLPLFPFTPGPLSLSIC